MSHLMVVNENNTWTGTNSFPTSIQIRGSSSGTVTLAALATAGTPTISLPSSSGTVCVSASSPFTLNGTTGNLTLGTVAVANGGTNITSYAVGDLIYASGSTTLSKLADVAVGSYLRSGGVTTAPLWSTLKLPNAATSGRVVFASATDTYGEDADFTFVTDTLTVTKIAGTSFTQGLRYAYVAKTANYTITTTDNIVDCTANSFDITLPTAVGTSGLAQRYVIKNSGTGVITIKTTSSQTIDGVASGILTLVQWDTLVVFSNNSNWLRE